MDFKRQTPKLLSDVRVTPNHGGDAVRPMFKAQRPQQYVGDIVTSAKPTRQSKPYARFYRPSPAPIDRVKDSSQSQLIMQAVKEAKSLPDFKRRDYSVSRKKSRPTSKRLKRAANLMIAVAIVLSGIMGIMIYKYHLALQKVEASPLQAEAEGDANGAEANVPAVAGLSEAKPKGTSGGSGKLAAGTPYKISIPKLKVSAYIVGVGDTKKGAMNVPGNIWQVGWYKSSAKPSDTTGVVVMNGHVHGPTQPGIFANLKKLATGDIISVTDISGTSYSYKVVTQQTIKAGDAGDELLSSISPTKQGLNLVTCTGKIKDDKYQDRLVVFAERV